MEAKSSLRADANKVGRVKAVGGRFGFGDVFLAKLACLGKTAKLIQTLETALIGLIWVLCCPCSHFDSPVPFESVSSSGEKEFGFRLQSIEVTEPACERKQSSQSAAGLAGELLRQTVG